ncbi:hypothetical protein [Haliscomenobacter hydrossis]|uniref:Uncharacterized protein n=1 Tax=Haliscomenobacter hydrossis (strain ATCC 27775 / DSM 1100 / LMG 10767 / O) TaxID=760192 RepID=F4L856_HALH1|nr:hypothetical protein [Haliscomenobacter hydrossis]AEE54564.1 hypothetical protein Halhy_6750 [Haliscomenobacter hydrossis DSM 1100]
MNEKIHTALTSLEDHLKEIKHWADLIKNTESVATDSIEKAATGIAKASLLVTQIQTDYETAVLSLQSSSTQMMAMVEDVIDEYKQLAKAAQELVDYLRSVNFPSRLDKIDTSIAGINQGVSNLSDKLERFRDQLITKVEAEHQVTRQSIQDLQGQVIRLKNRQVWFFGVSLFLSLLIVGALLYLILR